MARFNVPASNQTKTENRAGGEAFKQSDKLELVSILLTSMVQDQYYRSSSEGLDRLAEVIGGLSDKEFAAKAAVYARNEFGMRSISHAAAGEIGKLVKGEKWTADFFAAVVRRPDDITEILSYYTAKYGKRPLPNAMKRGLAKAFDKFDEYQLAKYRGEGKGFALVDAVNLVRPVPTKDNKAALKALVDGKLRSTQTWESMLTDAGNDEKKKAQVWASLLSEKKLGYFALLRNLRNIMHQAPDSLGIALEQLQDQKQIGKSLVLPFRFMSAYEQLQNEDGASDVLTAISNALDMSFFNVPKFAGKTLVVVDHSGSMGASYGSPFMKGALFGIAMAKANDADFMHFGDTAKYLSFNKSDSTLTLADKLDSKNRGWGESTSDSDSHVGHGTNFHAIFETANKAYDRIVIFSDMQGWIDYSVPTASFAQYKQRENANPRIFSVDLQGYGDMQFPEQEVYCIAGFSDKIFDLMEALEDGRDKLVNNIEEVELAA